MSEVPGRLESKTPVEKTREEVLREIEAREARIRKSLSERLKVIGSKPEPEPVLINPDYKEQLKNHLAIEQKRKKESARLPLPDAPPSAPDHTKYDRRIPYGGC